MTTNHVSIQQLMAMKSDLWPVDPMHSLVRDRVPDPHVAIHFDHSDQSQSSWYPRDSGAVPKQLETYLGSGPTQFPYPSFHVESNDVPNAHCMWNECSLVKQAWYLEQSNGSSKRFFSSPWRYFSQGFESVEPNITIITKTKIIFSFLKFFLLLLWSDAFAHYISKQVTKLPWKFPTIWPVCGSRLCMHGCCAIVSKKRSKPKVSNISLVKHLNGVKINFLRSTFSKSLTMVQ